MEDQLNKTEENEYRFRTKCEYCGKKFLTNSFFIDMCPKCMEEYSNFLVISDQKSTKD